MSTKSNLMMTDGEMFPNEALGCVATRMARSGHGDYRNYTMDVSVTRMTSHIAEVLHDFLLSRNLNVLVNPADIETFLDDLVHLRVLQITRSLPRGVISRDIPVPDFFRPILVRIGNFEDPFRSLTISLGDGFGNDEEDEVSDAEGGVSNIDLDQFNRVARRLKAMGVRFTAGLPGSLVIPDDSIFRIREDEEGNLLVAGPDVTEADLVVRSVVRIMWCEEIFGAARTRYLSVEDTRPAWEAIVSTALP